MRPLLVTAGATRNPIDAMRYISANSSGRTGARLARSSGTGVTLLGSPQARLRAPDIPGGTFESTRDLLRQMQAWCSEHPRGVVVHAAAVGDYEMAASAGKIPSGQASLTLQLRPAPKILDQIRGWSPDLRIISFKAAPPTTSPDELVRMAAAQRDRSGSDIVFGNALGHLGADLVIVTAEGHRHHETREAALLDLETRIHAIRLD